ncbi:MAG: chemotaxis protein CheC [Candidatus Omnitrophota bacterium]
MANYDRLEKNMLPLSGLQQDALKEIGNICAGNAATALSQLLNRKIEMFVPRVYLVPVVDVTEVIGGTEILVTAIVLNVLGDAPGVILLLFPQRDALLLSRLFTTKERETNGVMSDMERSAIKELGSILAFAYLNALSNVTGLGLVPSVPSLVTDMAGAIIDYILIELTMVSEYAMVLESEFNEAGSSAHGHFFLLPTPGSMRAILDTLKG